MEKNDGSGSVSTTNMDIDDLSSRFSRTMVGAAHPSMPRSSLKGTGRSKTNAHASTPAFSARSRSRTLPKTPPMGAAEKSIFLKQIEVDGDLARAIGYHVYDSTDEEVGIQVREEVVTHVKQNFDYYMSKFEVEDSAKLQRLLHRWYSPERQKGDSEFITAAASAYNTQFTVFGFNTTVAKPEYFCSGVDDRKPAYGMNGIFYMRELDRYMPVIVNMSPSAPADVDSQSSSSKSSKSGGTRSLLSRLSHHSMRNMDIPEEVEMSNGSPGQGLTTPRSESFLSRAFGSFHSSSSTPHTPPTDTATEGARTSAASAKLTMSPILEGGVETVTTPEDNEFDHQPSGHDHSVKCSSEMKHGGWHSTESRASRKSYENRKHHSSGSKESSKKNHPVRPLFGLEEHTTDTESVRRASKRLMAKAKKTYT